MEKQVVSTEENAPTAASPPGFEKGMDWNSDNAREAYESAGTTLEAEQRKGAPGEPDPIVRSDESTGAEADVEVVVEAEADGPEAEVDESPEVK